MTTGFAAPRLDTSRDPFFVPTSGTLVLLDGILTMPYSERQQTPWPGSRSHSGQSLNFSDAHDGSALPPTIDVMRNAANGRDGPRSDIRQPRRQAAILVQAGSLSYRVDIAAIGFGEALGDGKIVAVDRRPRRNAHCSFARAWSQR